MKKTKFMIGFILLFMVIGIAAVTTNVIVNMSTLINQNPDDFLVYFSDVEVNGTQDLTLVKSEKELVFNGEFSAIGDKKVISYDVTNASQNYDAEILIDCTQSTTYLNITNVFDMKNALSARSSRTGTLTIELSTAVSEEVTQDVTCTITANAVERDSQGSGDVSESVERTFKEGDEVSIGDEVFNVISTTDTTVTMLAQKNISDSVPYKQTNIQVWTVFSETNGWEYTPGPKEIDVQTWSGDVKTILNNYVSYLNTEYEVSVTGDLITLSQLGDLGCTVPSDYAYGSGGWTCVGSEYSDWLINGEYWWTRSAYSVSSDNVWIVNGVGSPNYYSYTDDFSGVRPVITISKSVLEQNDSVSVPE